jgi:hypothetical protein
MKYMLLIHDVEADWAKLSEPEVASIMAEYRALSAELRGAGVMLDGAQLQPTAAATSVQIRNGKRLVTDGPFAETREQLGGYFLIEARNLDEAISIAARVPSARFGTIEVRPLVESAAPAAT